MLANTADKMKDKNLYVSTLEKLVSYYPKKEYWADLLNRVRNKPGFASDRLELDLYRLKFALGQLQSASNYMEAAQLLLQEGAPAEAMKVIDQGFKTGALGTGSEAERHKRLHDLAQKQLGDQQNNIAQQEKEAQSAPNGSALVKVGYAYTTLGQADKGISLMQEGIKKDDLKHPEDDKLHTGIAMLQAGRKGPAIQMLRTVRGTDGTAELARYWILYANTHS
jgi:tetratricopeptide (TPR) repeat protein